MNSRFFGKLIGNKALDIKASWVLYDFSNSAYVLSGMTLFLPLYFSTHIHPEDGASQQWGILISIALFITAFTAPFVGSLADRGKWRFRLFLSLNIVFVLSILAMAFSTHLSVPIFGLCLVIATSCFGLCLFLYDSLIPGIFGVDEATVESGKGWAFGYFGGFACLLLVCAVLGFVMPGTPDDYRVVLSVVIVFYTLFSLPLLYRMACEKEDEKREGEINSTGIFTDVGRVFFDIVKNKQLLLYILCAMAMMDGLTTLTFFISIYAKSVLAFEVHHIAMLLVIVQLVAVPSTMLMSKLAASYGESLMLLYIAPLWIVVVVLIYFAQSLYLFCIVALLAGTLLGSTPAILRAWYVKLIPVDARSRYFGFNALASRVASVFGPLVFVLLASVYNERIAILSVIPFFVLAFICLLMHKN